jgi:hypothetical protein
VNSPVPALQAPGPFGSGVLCGRPATPALPGFLILLYAREPRLVDSEPAPGGEQFDLRLTTRSGLSRNAARR